MFYGNSFWWFGMSLDTTFQMSEIPQHHESGHVKLGHTNDVFMLCFILLEVTYALRQLSFNKQNRYHNGGLIWRKNLPLENV